MRGKWDACSSAKGKQTGVAGAVVTCGGAAELATKLTCLLDDITKYHGGYQALSRQSCDAFYSAILS
jgi:hypothetical protein